MKNRLKTFSKLARRYRRLCPEARESLLGAEMDYARLLNLESQIRHELEPGRLARIAAEDGTLSGYIENSPEMYGVNPSHIAARYGVRFAVTENMVQDTFDPENAPEAKQCAGNTIPEDDAKADFESLASL